MNIITINGQTYSGKNVSIINGVVTIDGKQQDGNKLSGIVRIELTGDLANVQVDAPIVVHGNVHGSVTAEGPVTCGNVEGDVDADGPCTCGNVKGNVTADGPCTCGDVGGDVEADMVIKS